MLAAFKDKQLLISVGLPIPAKKTVTGKVSVDLLDAAGNSVGRRDGKLSKFDASVILAFSFDNVNPADADKLRLRVNFKNQRTDVPLAKVVLAKGHETLVSAGTEFHAGSQASLQCTVQGVRSPIETVPHVGGDVTGRLDRRKKNKAPLFHGVTDKDGKVLASFKIPALPVGTNTRWKSSLAHAARRR